MELYDLLKYLINAFEKLKIRYFITGSIASMFYGEPRFTIVGKEIESYDYLELDFK